MQMRLSPLLVVLLVTLATRAAPAKDCPQWGRFEVTFANPKTYANPYRDVSLDATFTRPDGSTVKFWGFYDNQQTWRLRFVPAPGRYTLEIAHRSANFAVDKVLMKLNDPAPPK